MPRPLFLVLFALPFAASASTFSIDPLDRLASLSPGPLEIRLDLVDRSALPPVNDDALEALDEAHTDEAGLVIKARG